MNITITTTTTTKNNVSIDDIADEFSKLDSESQTEFLGKLFSCLKHVCQENTEAQLWHIAKDIKRKGSEDLKNTIGTLYEFIDDVIDPITSKKILKEQNDLLLDTLRFYESPWETGIINGETVARPIGSSERLRPVHEPAREVLEKIRKWE